MARVVDDRKFRSNGFQLNGNVPHRFVPEGSFFVRREATVNSTQLGDASTVNSFQGTNPQSQIGVDRVLYQYRNVYAFQGIGNFLYRERVRGTARAYPQNVYTRSKRFFHMLGRGNFNGRWQSGFLLGAFQPFQSDTANSFEFTRTGTRFPDACA